MWEMVETKCNTRIVCDGIYVNITKGWKYMRRGFLRKKSNTIYSTGKKCNVSVPPSLPVYKQSSIQCNNMVECEQGVSALLPTSTLLHFRLSLRT